ncbi:glycosyltransferase family 4 protein [Oricola sp.]|uniref:glycosyltransferase family 4 protein n=1 Tax=Oricola sp. TaxID=1979950 RepID=UPI003BAAC25F
MKLLILCNYFKPDLSAGSFRMQALVQALAAWRNRGLWVDVITTLPNRYRSLKLHAPVFEDDGWLRIHRIELPAHNNGMIDQARAYMSYARGVHEIVRNNHWDLVFATSSRLMTAALGAYISHSKNIPLYLDIRDLFAENMEELLAGKPQRLLTPALRRIERMSFSKATKINVVSEGFVNDIRDLSPDSEISVFTNGIDELFLDTDFFAEPFGRNHRKPEPDEELPLVVYAGNMGEGQGLHRVIPDLARRLENKARFRLIGDGGRKVALESALASAGVSNVELHSPVPREELLEHYRQADILFLHLNKLNSFKKVLPSKIFEYAATGKPIVAGVSGYAADFLRSEVADAAVHEPLDTASLASAIVSFAGCQEGSSREGFRSKFARSAIMANMASDVIGVLKAAKDAPVR